MRITESQLRRVVKRMVNEQVGSSYAVVAAEADQMAAEYGLPFYFDASAVGPKLKAALQTFAIGDNIAEQIIGSLPRLREVMSDTEAVIVQVAPGVLRFYDSDKAVLGMAHQTMSTMRNFSCAPITKVSGAGQMMDY